MTAARPKDKHSFSHSPYLTTLSHPKPFLLLFALLLFSLWLISFQLFFSSSSSSATSATFLDSADDGGTKCDPDIASFYIVPLPSRFNSDLLLNCSSLSPYTDMCPHVSHGGLGRPLSSAPSSWHATHQFIAEMIFHARAELHPCRTDRPSAAKLFLLPFYAGLYASSQFSQPNFTLRDSLALDFASLLPSLPSWPRRHGRDHFIVIGRTSWDFMRQLRPSSDHSHDFGANPLLLLPETQNISVLTVERHPWNGRNQFAIPYPSYFHPSAAGELAAWRATVLVSPRSHLFAFIGGPRPASVEKAAARGHILRQCAASPTRCLRVECRPDNPASCHDPDRVLAVMRRSEFCMQPPGDSFTRRSVFDAVLAGCIPVFFSENTAYTQYRWYLPARSEDWSVFLGPGQWDRIEEELDRIPKSVVTRMRERVVEMIPRMTYTHPNASRTELGFRDAVDVALVELTKIVRSREPQV